MSDIKDKIIEEILDATTIDEKGNVTYGDQTFHKYQYYFNLLKSELFHDEEFTRKMNSKRYYIPDLYETTFFVSHNMNSIFKQMKQDNKNSFNDFMGLLGKEMEDIEHNYIMSKFELYYPINISNFRNEIEKFRFRDIVVELLKDTDIDFIFKDSKIKNDIEPNKFDPSKYHYIKVTLHGRNKFYAEAQATKYVQLILGFLSFSKTFGTDTYTFFGIPKPLIELELSYVFAFKDDKYLEYGYFKDENLDRISYEVTESDIKNFNNILSEFNKAKDETIKDIICDAISCHYEGLIEKNKKYSFLNFWKVIEILSVKDKELPHYKIADRVKSILFLSNIDSYAFDKLYTLRNEFIHSGNNVNISIVDRNLIKYFAERYTIFFLFKLSKLPLSNIKMQYPYFEYDEDHLEEIKKAIDSVIKLKQRTTK